MFSWLNKRRHLVAWCYRYVSSFSSSCAEPTKSLAHTCWFRVPEQQMKEYEVLARGSGFIVRGKQSNMLWALVSAHVAAPFLFRNYFPQDWLTFVHEKHCKHSLYWEVDGQHRQIEAGNVIWKHDMLDIAAFGLEKQRIANEGDWESLHSRAVELEPLSDWVGKPVIIQGWQIEGTVGSGQEKIVASCLKGNIRVQQGIRYFIETENRNAVQHGMCGGPILLPENKTTCVGILEGLVPDSNQLDSTIRNDEWREFFRSVAGYAAFIEASVLRDFIDQLEKQQSEGPFRNL
ncbi:hypothetical protein GAYE_SCF46G5806 [Galdieria yellowstonensis]|uniref:Uncharacterized protein n=1 Tax=Galdieria yellowstonensis TaxID=3028027 RepID=A0AAV9IKS9_9RHOD|nr:hypothetical protein GAYE_SCF46G5806 [Galdieria yellowstonensis]